MAKQYSSQDFRGNELRNFKVHIYATMAEANAAVSTSTARIIYVSDQGQLFGGIPGAWMALGSPDALQGLMMVGSNYQLTLPDLGKLIVLSGAGPFTFTLPAQATTALPAGARVRLANIGAGTVTVAAASGTVVGPVALATGKFTELVLLEAGDPNGWFSQAYSVASDSSDGLMSAADKTKLDGIVAGAGVPVNADWNAVSGLAQILNKPSTFPPATHGHDEATGVTAGFMPAAAVTKLASIAEGAEANVNADWNAVSGDAQILNKPSSFPASTHGHAVADVTGLQTALDGKAASTHAHAISEVTGLTTALDAKSDEGHAHAISDVTGLDTALSGKAAATHSHAMSDVTGLETALSGKASTTHSHAMSDVTGLETALSGKQATITDILSLTPRTDDPASPTDGQIWLNSTAGKLRCRIGGATVDLN